MSEFFQGFLMALIFVSIYFGIGAWKCGQEKKDLRREIENLEKQIKNMEWEKIREKERQKAV